MEKKIVREEDIKVEDTKTDKEIAEIMGDLLKEKVFVYTKETDRTQFVLLVLRALQDEYEDRADVFLLVFERGITHEFALGVKKEIAKLWEGVIKKKHADIPEDFEVPANPNRARWVKVQMDATEKTIRALGEFIVH